MTLTIGVLTWGSPRTLVNSVGSWADTGLVDIADEVIVFAQELSPESAIDVKPLWGGNLKLLSDPENIGIAQGYKRLVEASTSDLFLFLENDWPIMAEIDNVTVAKRVIQAMTLLEFDLADVVRLRHRTLHGYPLWTLQFKDKEMERPSHLLDCVHWRENPELDFSQITKVSDMYFTFAKFANWTNNPTMFKTEFLRENILPRIGNGDAERDLQSWWENTAAIVAQGEGLFTHYRID